MEDDSDSSDSYSSSEDPDLPKRIFIARKPIPKNIIPEKLEEPTVTPLIRKNLKPTKIVLSLETKSKLKEEEEQKIKEQEKIKEQQKKIQEEEKKNKKQETVTDCKKDDIESKDTNIEESKDQNVKVEEKLKSTENKVEEALKSDEKMEESSEESELEDDTAPPKPKRKKPTPEASEYDPKNVHYEGDVAIYTDPKSGYQYKWCNDTNQWLPKSDVTYGFEDDVHTYTDTEGVKYFWDVDKNAWFPKIDDDFMARYQMSYGFVDNKTKEEEEKEKIEKVQDEDKKAEQKIEKDKAIKKKLEQAPPSWFEMADQQNTKVYVSNLPTDITEEEFVDLMQKCGLVMRDMQTQKMKVKLYTVPDTDILKGDGLCTYIKIESVELALNVLDGYLYRGKQIKVERAKFEMKGNYNPSLKPKKKRRKDKDKLKKMQEKLFDWRPEKMRGERSKHERVVIVKNLFEPTLFDREVSLILEYQQDLREECSKCGEVKRVLLYDRHPEGVAQITMKVPEEADEVVKLLNGRWFGQRQLTAEIWNGKTKYKIAETDSEITQRLDNWDKFLESDTAPKTEENKTEQPIANPAIKSHE